MLKEAGLFQDIDKVKEAIQALRDHEPKEGYYLAFSGGKDSIVIYDLAERAGVKFTAWFHLSTVDPPELLRYLLKYYPYPRIRRVVPKMTMWNLIVKKRMPPTRLARYCCEYFKENGGEGGTAVTGVRRAESSKRRKRELYEEAYGGKRMILNPIISWTDQDVWEYIRTYKMPYCELYDQGMKRIGCIGCPMGHPDRDFNRYPKFKKLYIQAFQRMIEKRRADGLKTQWETGQDCYNWWVKKVVKEPDQLCFGYGMEN